MHTITLVGSEKGGVGKTNTAFNLAVMRACAGKKVLLVDTDRQSSSTQWSALRAEAGFTPPLVCVQKYGKVGYDLAQLRESYEVIVDAGGQDSVELRQAIAVADKWIIPVRPSQLDLFEPKPKLNELSGQKVPDSKPVFEFNPGHPLIGKLDQEADSARFDDLSRVLFEQSALAAGDTLKDPAAYVRRLNKLLLELSA